MPQNGVRWQGGLQGGQDACKARGLFSALRSLQNIGVDGSVHTQGIIKVGLGYFRAFAPSRVDEFSQSHATPRARLTGRRLQINFSLRYSYVLHSCMCPILMGLWRKSFLFVRLSTFQPTIDG
jgi:hypothetical protein